MPPSLEALLKQNYNGIRDSQCIETVVAFISSTPSVVGRDVRFIKMLTKVAYHILQASPQSLDGSLDRLFQFNMEGIQKIQGGLQGYSQYRLTSLESHFFAHAGDVAETIYKKTKSLHWAERWYECKRKAADISRDIDPTHSAHNYSFAAKGAKAMFELTGYEAWGKLWFECEKYSADMTFESNPRHSAHSYSFAGDAAQALFKKTDDIDWAKIWYWTRKLSANMTVEINPKHSAHSSGIAAQAAQIIFKKIREPIWKERALVGYQALLSYYESNPDSKMGNLISRIKQNVELLRKIN